MRIASARAALALVALASLLACERERPPPVPRVDARVGRDAGTFDAGPIRRRDAGPDIDGGNDAGGPDAGGTDAGVDAGPGRAVIIDGVVEDAEWGAADRYESAVPAAGIFAGNALRALHVLRDDTHLYVAIEATLTTGNAIVLYVDRDLGGTAGLVSPTPLGDGVGALDRALSKELFTPADVRIDAAWGTTQMNRVASEADDRIGWREVATNPDVFTVLEGPSACGADACEAAIDLGTLGVAAGADVALFVRLVSASSLAISNQTLPMDATAEFVSTYAVAPR